MTEAVFYRGGGFEVTERLLRTPRRTYALARIEYVSMTRPLLLFLGGPALGIMGVVYSFRRYLLEVEIATILALCIAILIAAFLFGTLRVHSLALRGDDDTQTYGPVWRLRQVRAAVERAMTFSRDEEQYP